MNNDDKEWLNAQIDEIGISPEEFEMNLFLSTDGKNTISVKATTQNGRKEALRFAQRVYDRMLSRYGTKKAQEIEAIKVANPGVVCETCGKPAEHKSGISKTGKPWKGIFCSENKEHVSWGK